MPAAPDGALLALGAAFPSDRVPAGPGRRCAARPDEDAVTLAAEAGLQALSGAGAPAALILASVSPPYDEGGSAQVLAELLGLPSDTFVSELTATMRDGVSAIRLALALTATQGGPVLVIASHRRRASGDGDAGDGAVALLIGAGEGLARLEAAGAHTEELRDRWRPSGEAELHEGDASFVHEFGAARVARLLAEEAPDAGPVAVAGPNARAAGKAEAKLGGPGDPVFARTGILGSAHPLLRLACGLGTAGLVVGASGGMADAMRVTPGAGAAEAAAELLARATAGIEVATAMPIPRGEGFAPYSSGPRSWRERGQDLRLEGLRYGDDEKVHFPPPAAPPIGHQDDLGVPTPLARAGTVLTYTKDFVYPGADSTEMAVLDLDDGARFYCQLAMGEEIEVGDRVRLVPRRLHSGGGVVQYFWKAVPCP